MLSFFPTEFTRTACGLLAAAVLATFVVPQAQAAAVSGRGTWETTLQGRDLDGDAATFEAYYDTDLNITWLADANYAQTSGYVADGSMQWDAAQMWVANLDVNGIRGWRLPAMVDTGPLGCGLGSDGGDDCSYNPSTSTSEMAHMFYVTLGNKGYRDTDWNLQSDYGLVNTALFSNVEQGYWYGLEYAPNLDYAWRLHAFSGEQGASAKNSTGFFYAWAVRSGDVVSVPEPQTYALMGLGLAAVLVARKRRPARVLVQA